MKWIIYLSLFYLFKGLRNQEGNIEQPNQDNNVITPQIDLQPDFSCTNLGIRFGRKSENKFSLQESVQCSACSDINKQIKLQFINYLDTYSSGGIKIEIGGNTINNDDMYLLTSNFVVYSGDTPGKTTVSFSSVCGTVIKNCEITIEIWQCSFGCTNCNSINQCLNCKELFYPVEGKPSECWNEPKAGYYLEEKKNYKLCDESCAICTIRSKNCGSCNSIKKYYPQETNQSNCWNNKTKAPDHYWDNENEIYKLCDESCATCTDRPSVDNNDECNSCRPPNYFPRFDNNSICLNENTKENYYKKNGKYYKCDDLCLKCSKGKEENNPNCDECIENYYKISDKQGFCVNDTFNEDNYYFNKTETQFIRCWIGCKGCNGSKIEEEHFCFDCIDGFYHVKDKESLCFNKDYNESYYIFKDDFYHRCFMSCKSCSKVGDNFDMSCTKCFETKDYYQYKNTTNCYNNYTKPTRTYYDGIEGKYFDCFESCLTCNKNGELLSSNCETCFNYLKDLEITVSSDTEQPEPEQPEPEQPEPEQPEPEQPEPEQPEPEQPEPEQPEPEQPEKKKYLPLLKNPFQCINESIRLKYYSNYYLEHDKNYYDACFNNCATCNKSGNDSNHNCNTCILNYYNLSDNESFCYSKDKNVSKYFINTTTQQFIRCNLRCQECDELGIDHDSKCLECYEDGEYYPLLGNLSTCWLKEELPENYFLNKNRIFEECYTSCRTCGAKGNNITTNCTSCYKDKGYYPIQYEETQCFDKQTMKDRYPDYFYHETHQTFERCWESCAECDTGGLINDTNCTKCKEGYAESYHKSSMCYNESTKPSDYKLNENGLYQICTMNILCKIPCDGKTQRWYVNELLFINCIDGLQCNNYCPLYYSPTNRCVNQCVKTTFPEPITNYCMNCLDGTNKYLYNNKCYSKCPEGTMPTILKDDEGKGDKNKTNEAGINNRQLKDENITQDIWICEMCPPTHPYYDNIQKKCVRDCSNNLNFICNPCNGYFNSTDDCVDECPSGEDYDKNKKCQKRVVIDPKFDISHNPIDYHIDIMRYYINQTMDKEYKYILKRMINTIKDTNEYLELANYLILFSQMISYKVGTTTKPEIEAYYTDAIDSFSRLINTVSKITDLTYYERLLVLLTQYYLIKHTDYIIIDKFNQLKSLQPSLIALATNFFNDNHTEDEDELKNKQKNEMLSIYSVVMDMFNIYQNLSNAIDPQYNPSLSENLYYRISNIFIVDDNRLSMKKAIEDHAIFTFRLTYPNYSFINKNSYEIVNVPLSYIQEVPDSDLQIATNCMNDNANIEKMKNKKIAIQVCVPKSELVKSYYESFFVSAIYYKGQYPLYNINTTNASPNFIGVNVYSNNYEKISINSTIEPFKIYINTFNDSHQFIECMFYDEIKEAINADCETKVVGSFIICECHHLTDFGIADVEVLKAMSEDNLIYQRFKILRSIENYSLLAWNNAHILYITGGLFLLLIIGFFIAYPWDKKTYKNMYYDIVPKEYDYCDKTQITKGIDIINGEMLKRSKQSDLTAIVDAKVEVQQNIDDSTERDKNSKDDLDSSRKIQDGIQRTEMTNTSYSCFRLFCCIFRLFINYEYRQLIMLTSIRYNVSKSNLVILFFFRILLLLTTSGICASCQMATTKSFTLESMDYVAIFAGVVIVNIIQTVFELILARTAVERNKIYHFPRIKCNGMYRHVIAYLIMIGLSCFGVMNTLWVTLEILKQELFSMMYEVFLLSIAFDLLIYEFLILGFKSLIYSIIVKSKEKCSPNCFASVLIKCLSSLPWLFAIRWNEADINITPKSKTKNKTIEKDH